MDGDQRDLRRENRLDSATAWQQGGSYRVATDTESVFSATSANSSLWIEATTDLG